MSTKRCPNCGERLGVQAKFCKTCGTPVEPQLSEENEYLEQTRPLQQAGFDRMNNQTEK